MPRCIEQGRWQDEALLQQHWRVVNETLADADSVVIVGCAALPKHGVASVGAARQWRGRLGSVNNRQSGVFTAYASLHGYTLVNQRLCRPEEWCNAAQHGRRNACGVPEETSFQTTSALALEMLQGIAVAGALGLRGVTCDAACRREPAFRDGVEALPWWHSTRVSHDLRVWQTRPATMVPSWSGRGRRPRKARLGPAAPQRVDQLAAAGPLDG